MARLRILHETSYRYARPVTLGRHRLVLRPREGHELRVESMDVTMTPAHHAAWASDVFGNSILVVDFLEPTTELKISSEAIVLRRKPFPVSQPRETPPVPFPVVYDTLETTIAAAYQSLTYPDDLDAVRDWLEQLDPPLVSEEAEATVFRLGELIHQQMKYRRRMEKGVQTPVVTLQKMNGSCRDLATLMMEASRVLGFAARFVSGYLDCPASEAGRAAMHAWVEIYLPALGWRGYDPTLGEPVSTKHVAAGVSNHPRGVMPVSGMFSGSSGDYLEMTASVKIDKVFPDPPLEVSIP
ncbi:transglutaminase family protein [Planctomicrobium sp. SH661]|uniref:transglutaminase family protein n=1 Tax=Planctomicrobium sp. SH661 TaxID=3448124 RepID=UPI003F5C8361